ncbi:sulfatase-like hydrolase/transferase [Rubrivirga sp. IMCC45206]|uniref:sulfatase-like hydrolase/transferase n=1 Tax=Rubrivirga sp. IMCC45206 TaxID=3391614 RepID=UPI00398FCC16
MSVRSLAVALWVLASGVAAQPDVVVIVADDLGFADVGYHGSDIETPHLDALAGQGVVLDRFYVSPLCSPSRAGLLTGRYPLRAGIAEPVTHADTTGLGPDIATLADDFRAGGYETAVIGKWHLGTACHHHPLRHGFDSFVGLASGGAHYLTRQTAVGVDWWRGYLPDRPDGYTTDLIAAEAVYALTRPRAGPLFLYLPFTAPHTPLNAPDEDLAEYPDLPEPRRTYAAMVTALDRAVGRVMAAVQASGRPTLVWFLSDNGGIERHGGRNAPLRGEKGQTYEGGVRVPSVVWYPPWGARAIDHPVWYLDVAPTVLAAAGLPAPARALDGADLGPQLAGAPFTQPLLDRVLYAYRRNGPDASWLAAQSATWKLVQRAVRARVTRELFRIDRDPGETADSVAAYPALADALAAQAEAYAALTPVGAAHDVTLTVNRPQDFSGCDGGSPPPSAPGPNGRWLRATPNPAAAGLAVRVGGLPAEGARVEVFDAVGRRVRVLHDGPLAPDQTFRSAPGLPAGLYLVRVTEPAGVTTARVTVGR